MDIDAFLNQNIDEILNNSEQYVATNNVFKNKKVSKKKIKQISIENNKNNKNNEDNEDIEDKEYFDYNYQFYDNLYEYYDIDYVNNESDVETSNDEVDNIDNIDNIDRKSATDNETKAENIIWDDDYNKINEDDYSDDIKDDLYEKMFEMEQINNKIYDMSNNVNYNNSTNSTNSTNKTNSNTGSYSNPDANLDINVEQYEKDDGYYFFNLINIFMKYYNDKYDKKEHFFSNISDTEKGTSDKMEMFFEHIVEFKMFIDQMNITSDEGLNTLYKEDEPEKISKMFEKWNRQIYMFEMDELKLFSPTLITCFNYVYENNLLNNTWTIYNLRDN